MVLEVDRSVGLGLESTPIGTVEELPTSANKCSDGKKGGTSAVLHSITSIYMLLDIEMWPDKRAFQQTCSRPTHHHGFEVVPSTICWPQDEKKRNGNKSCVLHSLCLFGRRGACHLTPSVSQSSCEQNHPHSLHVSHDCFYMAVAPYPCVCHRWCFPPFF